MSELMPEAPRHPGFDRGAEVTHWNGVAIARAVASNAEREAGSNAAARHAQGLASMTIRWLGQSLPPDEDWIDVSFLPASTQVVEAPGGQVPVARVPAAVGVPSTRSRARAA